MSKYLNQVVDAKRRVELRECPQPDDVRIIQPYLAGLEAELAVRLQTNGTDRRFC